MTYVPIKFITHNHNQARFQFFDYVHISCKEYLARQCKPCNNEVSIYIFFSFKNQGVNIPFSKKKGVNIHSKLLDYVLSHKVIVISL